MACYVILCSIVPRHVLTRIRCILKSLQRHSYNDYRGSPCTRQSPVSSSMLCWETCKTYVNARTCIPHARRVPHLNSNQFADIFHLEISHTVLAPCPTDVSNMALTPRRRHKRTGRPKAKAN